MPLSRVKRRGRKVCVQCGQLAEAAHYLPEEGVGAPLQGSPQRPICPGCVIANYHAAREANRLRRAAVSDSEMAYWQEVESCEHGVDIARRSCPACKEGVHPEAAQRLDAGCPPSSHEEGKYNDQTQ